MKSKKICFLILEKIERKKSEKIIIDIQGMFLKKKENDEQLKLLVEYEKEYITKIKNQLLLGIFVYQWKNYNNFISVLGIIIHNHRIMLEENKKLIEKKMSSWSKSQKKIKIWNHLNSINKKKILKIKKIKEQIINDYHVQLKFSTKG
ncbi:Flij [Buchnera aphidicola str. USDA (Myzus persicae)]|uniref:Flagellar FliJ protein n=1 Tax=Buchnera aphidicola str. USDA (Myzus persicae) TaxID=1009856 RepID=W0P4J7_BUCMP|nr:flagellar FliJ family protein [Buchnera aphidicola]AHG60290.1 Flij [Buchnera aphidicola str. USDA (Myzus persicae)]